ncbi:MAG: hypothetical protein JRI96_07875 [Deltaproteobacteria bacterium]|nr:hypothetical protein [Deltaproteobacteria bacterium]
MIEILMTATRRPEVVERTLRSFKTNLFQKIPAKVIINIDPVGPGKTKDTLDVVGKYFRVESVNLPEVPHFGRAFKWVWSQAEAEMCFWLEDDWELLFPIDLFRMIKIMDSNQNLAILRLPWRPVGTGYSKNWKWFFPWNGEFFECPQEIRRQVGFCGHPSLVRGKYVRKTVRFLNPEKNPEKQFHHGNPELLFEIDRWRYGVFAQPGQGPSIRDIGREWMIDNGYRKAGTKAFFTQWRQIDA